MPFKKLYFVTNGVKVYIVDGDYVRDNFDTDFSLGGTHYVFDFIPEDEAWVEFVPHLKDLKDNIIHELVERYIMKNFGMEYEDAHKVALYTEKEVRDIKDKEQPGATADTIIPNPPADFEYRVIKDKGLWWIQQRNPKRFSPKFNPQWEFINRGFFNSEEEAQKERGKMEKGKQSIKMEELTARVQKLEAALPKTWGVRSPQRALKGKIKATERWLQKMKRRLREESPSKAVKTKESIKLAEDKLVKFRQRLQDLQKKLKDNPIPKPSNAAMVDMKQAAKDLKDAIDKGEYWEDAATKIEHKYKMSFSQGVSLDKAFKQLTGKDPADYQVA